MNGKQIGIIVLVVVVVIILIICIYFLMKPSSTEPFDSMNELHDNYTRWYNYYYTLYMENPEHTSTAAAQTYAKNMAIRQLGKLLPSKYTYLFDIYKGHKNHRAPKLGKQPWGLNSPDHIKINHHHH